MRVMGPHTKTTGRIFLMVSFFTQIANEFGANTTPICAHFTGPHLALNLKRWHSPLGWHAQELAHTMLRQFPSCDKTTPKVPGNTICRHTHVGCERGQ